MKTLKTDPKRLTYLANYRKLNRETLFEYHKNWAIANRDKERAKSAKYLAKNKEWNAEKSQKRRARFRSVEIYQITEKELHKLYNQPCNNCCSLEQQTLDHIIPITRNGRHSIGNLQTLCKSCNSKKRQRTIMEWRLNRRVAQS